MSFWEEFLAWLAMTCLIIAAVFMEDQNYRQSHLDNVPAAVLEGDYEEFCPPPDDPDFDCGCDGPIYPHCEGEEDATPVQ